MKRLVWAALAGGLAGVILLGWAWRLWTGPGPDAPLSAAGATPASVLVRIPAGMTLSAAADTLVVRGVLADRRVLLAGARLTRQERSLRAGLYALPYRSSPRDLLRDLTGGLSVQVRFTIPEGLTSREAAAIVAEALDIPPPVFLARADSITRDRLLSSGGPGMAGWAATYDSLLSGADPQVVHTLCWSEGYLAPDTYQFAEGTEAAAVAAHLVDTQLQRLAVAWSGRDQAATRELVRPHDLLALAAIVEAEARRDDERALVAAVYHNRLRQGWRLEADPTVAFLLDKKGKRLFFRDLKVESPFNTYRNKGLPPGPIGAPGLATLLAAARPDTTCRAMFFVSDGADGHVFSRTAREHQAAVRRFKAARSAQRRGN